VEHRFGYSEAEVARLLRVAARAACERRGQLHVIVKDGGVPGITALWRDIGAAVAAETGVRVTFMNADLAAYELVQHPRRFDVLAAPNLLGDILADITGALVGSRGVTFSGNFNSLGHAVYQTNHGCAHDLAGQDVANPAGQMLALAMLLRESFGLAAPAARLESALDHCWREGWRTADLLPPTEDAKETGYRVVGTRAMTRRVVEELRRPVEQVAAA
jgi:3-isopropylmalate dehydrogenase